MENIASIQFVVAIVTAGIGIILGICSFVWLYRCQRGITQLSKTLTVIREHMVPSKPEPMEEELEQPAVKPIVYKESVKKQILQEQPNITRKIWVNAAGQWICPVCDNKNEPSNPTCAKCNFVKP